MSLFSKLFGKNGGGTTVPSPLASSANEIINNTINNSKTITMTQQEIMAIAAAVANILNGNNNQSATTVITTQVETAPSTQSTPSTESTNSTPSTESTISTKELNYCIYSTLEGKPYNYAFYGEALCEDAINALFKTIIGDKAKVGKHKGNLKSIGEGVQGWRISVKNIEKSSYKTLDGVLNALTSVSPITLVERESVASVSDARREEQAKAKEAEKKEDTTVPEQEAEKKAIKDAEKAKAKDESRKTKDEGRKKKDEGKKEEPTSAPAQTVSLVTDLSAWDSTTLKVVCYDASKEEPVIRIETEVQKCPSCKNLYFRKDENGKYRIYAHAGNSQLYLIGITSADIPAGAPLGAKAETWEFIGNNGLVKAITTEVQKSVKPHMVAAYENSGKEDVYQWLKGLAA